MPVVTNKVHSEDDKLLLSTHLHWLDGAVREMRTPWMFTAGGAGCVFNMEYLIAAMLCSAHLKNQARLRNALSKAMSLVLPPAFVPHFREQLFSEGAETGSRLPGRTTLYRHRLSLACGMYVSVAHRNHDMLQKPGFARYIAIDKSPQGGRDWLMVIETCIAAEHLRAARQQAARLVMLSRRAASASSHCESCQTAPIGMYDPDQEAEPEHGSHVDAAEHEAEIRACMEELSTCIQVCWFTGNYVTK